jgi:hypothetical protein
MPRSERGQATVEWSALVLVVVLVLAGAGFVIARGDGWRFGQGVLDSIICAAFDRCPDALEDAYGDDVARSVREYAPNIVYERRSAALPVDLRRCRRVECSNGSDRVETIDASELGLPVTAFTRVIDRRRETGTLYVQYWLYFPESFSGGIGRKLGPLAQHWPGFHKDDWEGLQLRIGPSGRVAARATAHGQYKNSIDSNGWGHWTGWYRVSGGSHAGHLVRANTGERATPASSLRLVPLETLGGRDLERFAVSPPWKKDVYSDPESSSS